MYRVTDPETGNDVMERRASQEIADGACAVVIGADHPDEGLLVGTVDGPDRVQALFDAGIWSHPCWTLFADDTIAVKGRCDACGTVRPFYAAKTDGHCWNHTITPVVVVNDETEGISTSG